MSTFNKRKAAMAFGSVVLSAAIFTAPMTSLADNLDSLRGRANAQHQAADALRQKSDSQRAAYQAAQKKADDLSGQVAQTQKQINRLKARIVTADAQIAKTDSDIAVTEQRMKKNCELFMKQQRALYELGETSYLDVLLSASSITDFLTKVDAVQSIAKYQNNIISSIRSDDVRLKADKADQTARKKELSESEGALLAQQLIQVAQKNQQQQQANAAKSAADTADAEAGNAEAIAAKTDAQINAEIEAEAAARRAQLAALSAKTTKRSGKSGGSGSSGSGSSSGSDDDSGYSYSGSVSGSAIVGFAEQFSNCRYVYGAAGPNAFDCSGLVQYVYANVAGIYLPHSAAAQAGYGRPVSTSNLQPGDLVFFGNGGISHVGIYVGGNQFFSAENESAGIGTMNIYHFNPKYQFARRLLN